ncbi:MAG: UDP-N-acetylmuramoyl-tripeptide--D-alanyl-D-alanine ligase [Lachnospiraceae bacterium]|nr:UDP-N-acetylmuramoyl-tripeptide--D-alanyl-D-alanine ligase [Lachnospiraceae bacterium]
MKNLTPKNIAECCGGTFYGDSSILDKEISAVVRDSREIVPGCLFAAIKGERVDGHDFIPQVMEKGAMLALTERRDAAEDKPCIVVQSTLTALQDIARFYLSQLDVRVVSITGSVGKTSTKEMIASVLAQKYRTRKTQGNFNNGLGLPLTIFTLDETDEIAVLEMGINHFGEMDVLGSIAPPDISVITNIGTCHLEFLGDRDGVFRAKTEIFKHLKEGARVVLNGDDDKLIQVKEAGGREPLFYGIENRSGVYADNIEYIGTEAVRCVIHVGEEAFSVRIPYPGQHMVMNALAAACVGMECGVLPAQIRAGIETLELPGGRFRIEEGANCRIINDCYNANPMSMKAALKVLSEAEDRRVAILGDMGELGKDELTYHREVGEYAAELPLDLIIAVGPRAASIADAVREKNAGMPCIHFADVDALKSALPVLIRDGDLVLVKASHAMAFERVVDALKA